MWRLALVMLVASCSRPQPTGASAPLTSQVDEPPAPAVAARPDDNDRNSDGSPRRLAYDIPDLAGYTIVLPYDDFGPQAMSFATIGMGWWQWSGGGSWEPGDRFEIRVVVYRGHLDPVQARYPVVVNQSDYRYLPYADALAYLDAGTAEAASMGMPELAQALADTRARIAAALGAP